MLLHITKTPTQLQYSPYTHPHYYKKPHTSIQYKTHTYTHPYITMIKKFIWMCLIPNGYRDRAGRTYKNIVNGNKEMEITCCLFYFLFVIWCLNEKFVTVHNKCSKIPPSTSVHFANLMRRSRVVRLKLIFTFLYAGSSIQNARQQFVLCIHHSISMQPHTISVSYHHTTHLQIRRTTSLATPLRKYQNFQVFSSTKGIKKGQISS